MVADSNETVCTVPVTEEDMDIPIVKKIRSYLVCMDVWPACVSVYHVYAEARRKEAEPLELGIQGSYELFMVLRAKPRSSTRAVLVTAEPLVLLSPGLEEQSKLSTVSYLACRSCPADQELGSCPLSLCRGKELMLLARNTGPKAVYLSGIAYTSPRFDSSTKEKRKIQAPGPIQI